MLHKKTYEKRFEKLIQLLSSNRLLPYARQNNNNTFSRIRKMPLKDILLCCLAKKGLTTDMELRKYFKEKMDKKKHETHTRISNITLLSGKDLTLMTSLSNSTSKDGKLKRNIIH